MLVEPCLAGLVFLAWVALGFWPGLSWDRPFLHVMQKCLPSRTIVFRPAVQAMLGFLMCIFADFLALPPALNAVAFTWEHRARCGVLCKPEGQSLQLDAPFRWLYCPAAHLGQKFISGFAWNLPMGHRLHRPLPVTCPGTLIVIKWKNPSEHCPFCFSSAAF